MASKTATVTTDVQNAMEEVMPAPWDENGQMIEGFREKIYTLRASSDALLEERDDIVLAIKHLRVYMKEHGWTMRHVAMALGVPPSMLSKWTMDPIDRKPDIICTKQSVGE